MKYLISEATIYDTDKKRATTYDENRNPTKEISFSKKEVQVLKILTKNIGKVLSHREIYKECWVNEYDKDCDFKFERSEIRNITNTISKIKQKTSEPLNKSYISSLKGYGYTLDNVDIKNFLPEAVEENALMDDSQAINTDTKGRELIIRNTLHDLNVIRSKYVFFSEEVLLHPENRKHATRQYLTELERFAVGVNMKTYDIEAIRRSSGGNLITSYKQHMRSFIQEVRCRRKITAWEIEPSKLYCEYEMMIKELYNSYNNPNKKWEPIEDVIETLETFLKFPLSSTDDIFKKFRCLPNIVSYGKGKKRFIYVPGTREDRCLLVAHMDTVWDYVHTEDKTKTLIPSEPEYNESQKIYQSKSSKNGIGADDRAGCAMLWLLRNSGHSLLIVDGEEKGQQGSHYIEDIHPELFQELNNHSFILQLDRRNATEFRCYNIPITKEFEEFIANDTGYTKVNEDGRRGRTDIVVLCKSICGANLSIGYYNEHTAEEYLKLDEWFQTYCLVRDMIDKPLKRFPLSTTKQETSQQL